MKIGRVFLSGCAVYVLVAACSAVGRRNTDDSGLGGKVGPSSGGGRMDSSGDVAGSGAASGTYMDPVPIASADMTSGSRLKAKKWHGVDGSEGYVTGWWYDSQLMTDCGVRVAPDGKQRCLPVNYNGEPSSEFVEMTLVIEE
jgi:hypothetical protein